MARFISAKVMPHGGGTVRGPSSPAHCKAPWEDRPGYCWFSWWSIAWPQWRTRCGCCPGGEPLDI